MASLARRSAGIAAAVAVLVLACAPRPVWAACPGACPIPGGGGGNSDCLAEFDGMVPNAPAHRPKYVRCVDGDPSCDRDGVADGVCSFEIRVCFNNFDSRFPRCEPLETYFFDIVGTLSEHPSFDPQKRALILAAGELLRTDDPLCTPLLPWTVELRRGGLQAATEIIRSEAHGTVPRNNPRTDRDTVKAVCLPSPG